MLYVELEKDGDGDCQSTLLGRRTWQRRGAVVLADGISVQIYQVSAVSSGNTESEATLLMFPACGLTVTNRICQPWPPPVVVGPISPSKEWTGGLAW